MLAASSLPIFFHLLAIMLLAVVGVSLLLLRVQRSLLVAYFLCGVLIANVGLLDWLGGDESQMTVNQMAEFGVMLLMFVLGMEFSVRELKFLRRFALIGGGLQMLLCAGIAMIVAKWAGGFAWPAAIITGAALGMSSTAVSLKSFQDMGLAGSAAARLALGIAIFQDLFIIAFLVFLPLLTAAGGDASTSLGKELLTLLTRGAIFVGISLVAARYIIPQLLTAVAHTRIRELFTLTVVGCCLGLAWIGGLLELSLALGAFVAGLAVSESVFKHRILADIMPVKDIFLTLFFVSVGLMVDLSVAFRYIHIILLLTGVLILVKAAIVYGVGALLGQVNRTSVLAALSLCSAGEFSLLLFQKAGDGGLWSEVTQQCLVTSAALSMAVVPGLMSRMSGPIGRLLERCGMCREHTSPDSSEGALTETIKTLEGHAIVCGFGPVGRTVHQELLDMGISPLVVELNVKTVKELAAQHMPVLFADASHEETWALARLGQAQLVVLTMPDAEATEEALRLIRELDSEICVLVRTRFASHQERFESLGASAVIFDESEVAHSVADAAVRMVGRG